MKNSILNKNYLKIAISICVATLIMAVSQSAMSAQIAMPTDATQWIQFSGNFADEGLRNGGGATGGDAVGGVGYLPSPSPNYFIDPTSEYQNAYATAMNNGSVMRSVMLVDGDSGFLYNSMVDTYTVSGANIGETITVNINFHVAGSMTRGFDSLGRRNGNGQLTAEIGTWSGDDTWNFNEQFRVNAFSNDSQYYAFLSSSSSDETLLVDHLLTYEMDVVVGSTFDVAYGLALTGRNLHADFGNTATVSIDAPEGITITSELNAVPVPAAGWLLLSGIGALAFLKRKH